MKEEHGVNGLAAKTKHIWDGKCFHLIVILSQFYDQVSDVLQVIQL